MSLYPCLQGKAAMVMYAQFEKDRDRNDFSLLPELHSILSGMKVGRGGAVLCSLSAKPSCCWLHRAKKVLVLLLWQHACRKAGC